MMSRTALSTPSLLRKAAVAVFALCALAVNAHYAWTEMNTQLSVNGVRAWPQAAPDAPAALGLAVAVMTLVTVPGMVVVDIFRRGAFTSMIAVELGWLGFLDVLWLASAAYTTSVWPPLGSLCALNGDIPNLVGACADVQAGMAFGWLNWLSLTGYLVTLLVVSIISSSKGSPVWKSTVKTANWATGKGYAVPPMQLQMQATPAYGARPARYDQPYTPSTYAAAPYDPPRPTEHGYGGGAEV